MESKGKLLEPPGKYSVANIRQVARELEPWPEVDGIRRASVNNFGYGGTNAHFIMEDYKSFVYSQTGATNGALTNGSHVMNGWHGKIQSRVVMLSAKDEQAALTMASNLKDHLQTIKIEDEEKYFDSLVYTLGQRRSIFPWISAQPVQGISGLIKALESERLKPSRTSERPKIGTPWAGN
jgi:acyl transferase domain-containing protein